MVPVCKVVPVDYLNRTGRRGVLIGALFYYRCDSRRFYTDMLKYRQVFYYKKAAPSIRGCRLVIPGIFLAQNIKGILLHFPIYDRDYKSIKINGQICYNSLNKIKDT